MAPLAGRTRLLSPHALLVDAGAALPPAPALDPLPLAGAVVTSPIAPVPVAEAVASVSVPVVAVAPAAEGEDEV